MFAYFTTATLVQVELWQLAASELSPAKWHTTISTREKWSQQIGLSIENGKESSVE